MTFEFIFSGGACDELARGFISCRRAIGCRAVGALGFRENLEKLTSITCSSMSTTKVFFSHILKAGLTTSAPGPSCTPKTAQWSESRLYVYLSTTLISTHLR